MSTVRLAVGALVPIRAARSFSRSGPASAISISEIRWVAVIAGPSSAPPVMRVSVPQQLPELLEDHRRVRCGAHAHHNSCISQ